MNEIELFDNYSKPTKKGEKANLGHHYYKIMKLNTGLGTWISHVFLIATYTVLYLVCVYNIYSVFTMIGMNIEYNVTSYSSIS